MTNAHVNDSATERSPLLNPTPQDASLENASAPDQQPQSPPRWSPIRRWAIVAHCLVLLWALEFGGYMSLIPKVAIMEEIVCRDFHPDLVDAAADPRCKNEAVQSELSMLRGWGATFDLIPCLLTSVPYGLLADRTSRKFVFNLAVAGEVIGQAWTIVVLRFPEVFPIRTIWLGSLSFFVGGGATVFMAMIFAITSDISTESIKSTMFFYLGAALMLGSVLGSPAAFLAMNGGAWFSMSLGYGFLVFALVLGLFLPDTRDRSAPENQASQQEEQESEQASATETTALLSKATSRVVASFQSMSIVAQTMFWENKKLGILLSTIMFTTLGSHAADILMQYATKRFDWSWSEAGLLLTIRSGTLLALTAIILPLLSQFLLKRCRLSSLKTDWWIVRGSLILIILGSFGAGFSTHPAMLIVAELIYAAGGGYPYAFRSLLTQVAGEQHVGMLFTTMAFLQTVGSLISGPLMALAYRIGLGWGSAWLGLPFLAAGCLYLIASLAIFNVRLGPRRVDE